MYALTRSKHAIRLALARVRWVDPSAQRWLSSAEEARRAAQNRAASRRGANADVHPGSLPVPPSLAFASRRTAAPTAPQKPTVSVLNDDGLQTIAPTPAVYGAGRELVLSPPGLVVTREMEWGNILVGFEQANKYTIRAAPGGQVVGFIAEEDGIGKSIARNFLKTHRSFKATVLDKSGDPVFVIRRPFYFVSTEMYVDEPDGTNLGKVEMQWHLWRRRYAMFTGKEQFAQVDSGLLAVDFDMRDGENKRIASVNKDFTGVSCLSLL
jgi:uncharacterized protein YxjI